MYWKKFPLNVPNIIVNPIILVLKDFLSKKEEMFHSTTAVVSRLLVCNGKYGNSQILNYLFNSRLILLKMILLILLRKLRIRLWAFLKEIILQTK